mgnify:CR=1 FL=1
MGIFIGDNNKIKNLDNEKDNLLNNNSVEKVN